MMLPLNLRFKTKQIQRSPTLITGIVLVYAGRTYVASARYGLYTDKKRMKILDITVHKDWQKRGIGTILSDIMKAIAKGYKLNRIILTAAVHTTAWQFWEKQGFQFYNSHYMEFLPQPLNTESKIG